MIILSNTGLADMEDDEIRQKNVLWAKDLSKMYSEKEIQKSSLDFVKNLNEKMYWAGSARGFIMGAFTGFINNLADHCDNKKLIEDAQNLFDTMNKHLDQYDKEIYEMIVTERERLENNGDCG